MAYRTRPLSALLETLLSLPRRRQTLVVGIDGRGGSGKSTLARGLAREQPDVAVVEMDDFYRPSADRREQIERGYAEIGGAFDWRRVQEQVLEPLAADQRARYQRYDWDRDELAEWHEIEPGGIVIVEGNYSTRFELRSFYDFTIWVDAPHDLRLARGVERDGEKSRERWLNEWMVEESRYIDTQNPAGMAALVVDGSADVNPSEEFRVLAAPDPA